jgi:heptaprenyl diphosphate synthase
VTTSSTDHPDTMTVTAKRGSRFLSGGQSVFASSEQRDIARALDDGLDLVEAGLVTQLRFADDVADSVGRYLFDAGGKRVRPLLTLLTSQWGEGITDDVITAAQVIELTHLATLYHDDVMDEAQQRRGVTAAQKVWSNSIAILAGDLLFARAGSLGVGLGQAAMRRQAHVFERLVLGQMRETVGPKPGDDPISHYLRVLSDKTGSLIALAAEFGVTMSGAPTTLVGPVTKFGEDIGIAFQLVDDVIDLADPSQGTGKLPGTDVRRGVTTLPMLLLEQHASDDSASAHLLTTLRKGSTGDIADDDFQRAIVELRHHPVTSQTMDTARDVADRAVSYLDDAPPGVVRDALVRFAGQVVERSQ